MPMYSLVWAFTARIKLEQLRNREIWYIVFIAFEPVHEISNNVALWHV